MNLQNKPKWSKLNINTNNNKQIGTFFVANTSILGKKI